jgi:hypothetical protein
MNSIKKKKKNSKNPKPVLKLFSGKDEHLPRRTAAAKEI